MATIRGNNADNILTGTPNDDSIFGLGGKDKLFGLAGIDLLDGGTGNDRMEGGSGDDSYYVDSPGDLIIEQANADGSFGDTVFSTVSYTLPNNVENLTLTGTRNINGTGNNESNTLIGNIGDNKLTGLDGSDSLIGDTDRFSNLSGDARGGNDFLYGGAADDSLLGDSFSISDSARGGSDHLIGGEGQEYLYGDALFMGGNARGGNDYLDGGPEYGFPSGDFLSGDCSEMGGNARGGNDYLNGGPGYGTLRTRAGISGSGCCPWCDGIVPFRMEGVAV
jgi:Ca2+-binding RTX toxin-like protein